MSEQLKQPGQRLGQMREIIDDESRVIFLPEDRLLSCPASMAFQLISRRFVHAPYEERVKSVFPYLTVNYQIAPKYLLYPVGERSINDMTDEELEAELWEKLEELDPVLKNTFKERLEYMEANYPRWLEENLLLRFLKMRDSMTSEELRQLNNDIARMSADEQGPGGS